MFLSYFNQHFYPELMRRVYPMKLNAVRFANASSQRPPASLRARGRTDRWLRLSLMAREALNHTAASLLSIIPFRRSHHPALYLAPLAGCIVGRTAPQFETKRSSL